MTQLRPTITCTACGNNRPHHGHGWCNPCWTRWRNHGRPASGPPPATRGSSAPSAERCDIDELAVAFAIEGRKIPLNAGERRAAIAALRARGLTYEQVADRLGCTDRTVARHVAALKETAR